MSLPAALAELGAAARRPIEDAVAMPPGVYTDPAVLALEEEHVFRREWLCLGRESSLAGTGDYLTASIAGEPLFAVRGADRRVRAFSNVCRHRMSLLLAGSGTVKAVVCPYHAWSYDLEGRLRGAPYMTANQGFRRQDYRLPELRCETWEGWLYVSLDPAIEPVAERLRPLDALIGRYRMAGYVETFREEHDWDTNWKILAENFMESYHLPTLHRATVGPYSKVEEMECPPGGAAFNYHWITKEASLPIGNAHPGNRHLEGRWRNTTALLTIYPTHLITLTPGYFWYLILQPRGVGGVHIVYGGGMAPEFIADPASHRHLATLKALLDEVNAEDRRGVEAVFRGAGSRLARGGHLSHLERPNQEFGRYLARRLGVLDGPPPQ